MGVRRLIAAFALLLAASRAIGATADGALVIRVPAFGPEHTTFLLHLDPVDDGPRRVLSAGPGDLARFEGVRPGAYRLRIECAGFEPAELDVRVNAWDEIAVEAGVPASTAPRRLSVRLADRSQPAGARVFDSDDLRGLPGARDVWLLAGTADARAVVDRIDNGGLYAGEAGRFSLRGASWTQAVVTLGGIDLTDPDRGGVPLIHVPLEALATAGLFAEAPGPVVRLEPRRPGRAWRGAVDARATPAGWQQDERPPAPSIARYGFWTDVSVSADGPLVADRLGALALVRVTRASRFERESATVLSGGGDVTTLMGHLVFTSRPSSEARALAIYQERQTPAAGRARFPAATADQRDRALVVQGDWMRQPESGFRAVVSGAWQAGWSNPPAPPDTSVAIDRLLDGPVSELFASRRDINRLTFSLALAPDVRRIARGRHDVRAELSLDHARVESRPAGVEPTTPELVAGLPARLWDYGFAGPAARWRATRASAAVFDAWTPVRGLSVHTSLGLTFQHGAAEDGGTMAWRAWSPSISVRYRLPRSPFAFVGGLARAPQRLLLRSLAFGDPHGPQGSVYLWNDRDGNRRFDPGERGALVARVGPGGSFSTIDPDLHAPVANQLTAGFEITISGWRVTLTGVRRRERNLLESVNTGVTASSYRLRFVMDPGVDYVGPQDDRLLPIYDRDPASFGLDRYVLANLEGHDMLHEGLELGIDRRVGDRLHVAVAATASRSEGSGGNRGFRVLENDAGVVGELYDEPNADTYSRGRLFFDRAYTVAVAAHYRSPRALHAGVVARYQDGQPFARLSVATELTQGPEAVQAVSRGDHRFTYTLTLDARLDQGVRIGRARLAGIVEVFNLLGARNEVEEDVVSGPAFRGVTAIQPPRAIRFGVRIER